MKRQKSEGVKEDSQFPPKLRRIVSNTFRGLNHCRNSHELVPCLEPIIRKWVQEAAENAVGSYLRSCDARNQIKCSESRTLQLQFHSVLPQTLFTGSRLLSNDKAPVKIVLYDTHSKKIVTSDPLSSIKVIVVVLDADIDDKDWTTQQFDGKTVKNREGKRPLLMGELAISLHEGVGYISDVSFTDNSSWIRSGKFRLGAKVLSTCNEANIISEAMSNPFRVKDQRGESYQKHYPPSLNDEVWRLEKIAKDGVHHKRLKQFGILTVGDFLRFLVTNKAELQKVLSNPAKKTWDMITEHAQTCPLENNSSKYMWITEEGGMVMFFDSAYRVCGVSFDGHSYFPVNDLDADQKRTVEDLTAYAYKNMENGYLNLVLVS